MTDSPAYRIAAALMPTGQAPLKAGAGWLTRCPAHDDRAPSLKVEGSDGKVLTYCHAGCDSDAVIAELKKRGLWPGGNGPKPQARDSLGRPVATYDYLDAAGKCLFQVCRFVGADGHKTFRQRRPDPAKPGGWIWNVQGVSLTPYRLPELLASDLAAPVFVVEGEKDCNGLATLGLAATTNPQGAGKWRAEFNQHFKGRRVAILPDNDPPCKAHALDVARNLSSGAASVKIVELPGLPEKGDAFDWIAQGGTAEALLALADAAPEWTPQAQAPGPQVPAKPKAPKFAFHSCKEIAAMDLPEPKWIIKDLLPEGYGLLAGRPKLGKSWLALAFAVAVATGGCGLGRKEYEAIKARSLIFALEDRLRRIKLRQEIVLAGTPYPDIMHAAETLSRLDAGGLDDIACFLDLYPDCRLIIIDTLAKVMPLRLKSVDPFAHDHRVGAALQALAHKFGICLLAIVHTRKSAADDPLDTVLGSTGITAPADFVMVLKRGRGGADGKLTITGRDILETELALKFKPDFGAWECLGNADEHARSLQQQEIIDHLKEAGAQTPAQIAKALGKKAASVRMALKRMKENGLVRLNFHGLYEI